MKIWYDTEFIEDGRAIGLISVGMVAEDGREYYAVNRDMPVKRIRRHPWLMTNVVPSLPHGHGDRKNTIPRRWLFDYYDPCVRTRSRIADNVRDFIRETPSPELWAWYGAYDHVVLCQLWGPMVSLPNGVPMWTNDLKQEAQRLGNPQVPQQDHGQHNALADARHNKVIAEFLDLAARR